MAGMGGPGLGPCAVDVVELYGEVGETESRVKSVGALDDGENPALEVCRDAAAEVEPSDSTTKTVGPDCVS